MAAATNLTTTLPTIVVEASRTSKAPMELAQHVETLGEAQIAASEAKNLPGPLTYRDYKHDPTKSVYRDSAHLTSYGVNFTGRGVINDENEVDAVFTFSQRHAHYTNDDTYPGFSYLRDYKSNLWNFRLAPQYTCTADILDFKNEFLLGGELKYNLLHGDSHDCYPELGIDSRENYETDRWTSGMFARDEFWILNPLSILIGARLERDWNKNTLATKIRLRTSTAGATASRARQRNPRQDGMSNAVASVTSGENAWYPAAGRSFMFTVRYEF